MIKLGDLVNLKPITEADVYTATSKETGTTSVFKSKDARDAAIKAGTHEKRKGDKDGGVKDPTDKPKVNIFNKDKKEPKSSAPKLDKDGNGGMSSDTTRSVEDYLNKELGLDGSADLNSGGAIEYMVGDSRKAITIGNDEIDGKPFSVSLSDIDTGESNDTYKSFDNQKDAIAYAKELGQKLKGGKEDEPKDSGRPKDSSGGRAGNPQVNKAVRKKAEQIGLTPQKLGREEYELRMVQAAHEALTDSNFHSEARKLIAIIEDNPELEKNPANDPNKPDLGEPGYEEWQKGTAWGSKYGESSEGTDELGQAAASEAGWAGKDALDGIAFELKMRGFKNLALKIQSVFDDEKNESTKLGRLLPESIINEGTRSQVGIIDRSGKIASAYVHYDGYPSNMKPGLKKHMKNEKDVLNLIKQGGARGIYNDKDIEYYKSGKPTKGNLKDFEKYVDAADRNGMAEYVYLYNMKDKKWYFADVYGDKKLKKLF